jgi:hypothetical protein
MNRHAALEKIHAHLEDADDDTLDNVLYMLEHMCSLDNWDKEMIADSKAGKFDKIIAQLNKNYADGEYEI